jgi:O-methyltransferase
MLKRLIRKSLNVIGYDIIKKAESKTDAVDNLYPDYRTVITDMEEDHTFFKIYQMCKDYTMTTIEASYSIYKSIEYLLHNNVQGDFVECGVWRGGSCMFIAFTLLHFGEKNKKIYLYDTFSGMTEPQNIDVDFMGHSAKELLSQAKKIQKFDITACADIEDVRSNLYSTGYPEENIIFVQGKVEETIPQTIPEKICLLRLDTDWYQSTYHELRYLYPIVSQGGIIIIDDYGHWRGAKYAVDSYLEQNGINILLNRIDYTCRLGLKYFI